MYPYPNNQQNPFPGQNTYTNSNPNYISQNPSQYQYQASNIGGYNSNPTVAYGQPGVGGQLNTDTFNGFKIYGEFKIRQKLLTIGMDMRLELNGSQFGYIKQKVLSFGKQFQLQDGVGSVVAVAKEKVFNIGRDFQIFDSMGMKVGSITEQVLKSMFSVHRKYTIRDGNGIQIGTTKQLQIGSKSDIEIFNQMGVLQAKFSEEWFNLIRENWYVRFLGFNIDRRLLIFFPSIISQRQES